MMMKRKKGTWREQDEECNINIYLKLTSIKLQITGHMMHDSENIRKFLLRKVASLCKILKLVCYLVPWLYLSNAENKGEAHCEVCGPHGEAKQSSPSLREGLCTH